MANILVVDDSTVMRNLLREFLTDAGHAVETSDDGEDGLQKALSGHYDICICDMHMPKVNGYELLCRVTEGKPHITVIFTDSMPDSVSEKVQQSGSYHLLRKPFELTQLRAILDKILKTVESP